MAELMVGKSLSAPARECPLSRARFCCMWPTCRYARFALRHALARQSRGGAGAGEVLEHRRGCGQRAGRALAPFRARRRRPPVQSRWNRGGGGGGEGVGALGPNERRMRGLLCAPEERLGHAAAPE